ncbi:hypothetical protein OIU78_004702 [Salix suchowensis]|nr:hypothetical protein OIU78_004702 [Salix suchowensis]
MHASWPLSSSRGPIKDIEEENKFQDGIAVAFPVCYLCIRSKSSPSTYNDPINTSQVFSTKSMYPKEATVARVLDDELSLGHASHEHKNGDMELNTGVRIFFLSSTSSVKLGTVRAHSMPIKIFSTLQLMGYQPVK